jgi:hypothetical protein
MNDDELKHQSPAQNAARIVFACGITALVVISVYYGILWLFGPALTIGKLARDR